MPPRNLLFEHLIHKLMLLDHAQALELGRLNRYRVHAATTPRNVLDLWNDIVSVCSVAILLAIDASGGSIVCIVCLRMNMTCISHMQLTVSSSCVIRPLLVYKYAGGSDTP
jgi:hypothetical protein